MNEIQQFWEQASLMLKEHIIIWYCINAFIGTCIASCIGLIVARTPNLLYWTYEQEVNGFLEERGKQKQFEEKKKPDGYWFPSSRCDSCNHTLKLWHNIPILSWIFLRGKCGFCKTKIPVSVLLIEVAGALSGFLMAYYAGVTPIVWVWLIALGILTAAIWIDWNIGLIPDGMVYVLLWGGLAFSYFYGHNENVIDLRTAFLGVFTGYIMLWGANVLSYVLFRKQGMGDGDLKLLAALGAWFGSLWVLHGFVISLGLGIVSHFIHKAQVIQKQKKDSSFVDGGFPFGPSLAIGVIIAFLLGYFHLSESWPLPFYY